MATCHTVTYRATSRAVGVSTTISKSVALGFINP
jgi:hypothetical protein